jgi:hypothetical protein
MRGGQHPATTRAALSWLVDQKDATGTWHSTQATVLALKALILGTGRSLGGDKERRIEVVISGRFRETVVILPDQGEVMKQIDLSAHLKPGEQVVSLTETSGTGAGYQVAFRYHVPGPATSAEPDPLTVTLTYDRTELSVNDVVTATATVANRLPAAAPMVIVDLPIPAGFALESGTLEKLARDGTIAKFQLSPRQVIVYLRGLEPGKPLTLTYRLRATLPVTLTVPAARAYEYYNPDRQGRSAAGRLVVK